MDETLKSMVLWFYISVVIIIGLGLLWVVGAATFWMLPPMVDPPTVGMMLGLGVRICIVSLVSAFWSAIGVLGWRRLGKTVDDLLEKVDS